MEDNYNYKLEQFHKNYTTTIGSKYCKASSQILNLYKLIKKPNVLVSTTANFRLKTRIRHATYQSQYSFEFMVNYFEDSVYYVVYSLRYDTSRNEFVYMLVKTDVSLLEISDEEKMSLMIGKELIF